MTQMELPMLTRFDGPSVVHPKLVKALGSYREAVLLCWAMRRDKADGSQSACARFIGCQVSHMSSYLSADVSQRDMPGKYVSAFQVWCGNTAISQYLARSASLSVAEEFKVLAEAA